MALSHGGHLSHGLKVNFSGGLYEFQHYGVRRGDCRIDMDQVRDMAREQRPALIVAGASAYPRIIDFAAFREIADEVGARLMVDMAHIAGLVAAGLHPTPVGVADLVTTTTHKTLGGPRAGMVLSSEELATAVDRAVFPGLQGGPLMHVIAGKAVALGHALTPEFQARQEQTVANCRALAAELVDGGLAPGERRHRQPPPAGGPVGHGRSPAHDGEERLHRAGITVNKNGVPFDERPAHGHLGPAHRDPRAHHARPGRGRDARDRPGHRRRAPRGGLRRRARGAARPLPRGR